jgi:superfamily I DNA/RNA helicase
MADLLGGRLDPASALLGVARAREEHCDQLTRDQFVALRFARSNPCIKLVGGPGTGKTWLALEQARTWAAEGKRVLFVCYSIGLSRWLRTAVAALGGSVAARIDVSTYSAYLVGRGVDVPPAPDQHWWEVTLPELAAELVTPAYDALVVDEAQDFADSWWPLLLASLRDQRMLVAGDEQQTVFANRRGAPDVTLHSITLDENVRNTTQIASVFNPLASERMRFRGGDGPPVRLVPCASEDAHDVADRVIEELLESGQSAGSIAVLTTRHRHQYHRQAEEQLEKTGYWDGFWLDDEVFYGTVMGFKGLERPAVVLAVDGFHDGVAREVMYTGLSRARDQLVVCGDIAQIREVVGKEVAKRLMGG